MIGSKEAEDMDISLSANYNLPLMPSKKAIGCGEGRSLDSSECGTLHTLRMHYTNVLHSTALRLAVVLSKAYSVGLVPSMASCSLDDSLQCNDRRSSTGTRLMACTFLVGYLGGGPPPSGGTPIAFKYLPIPGLCKKYALVV
jgi:hypothetical protein